MRVICFSSSCTSLFLSVSSSFLLLLFFSFSFEVIFSRQGFGLFLVRSLKYNFYNFFLFASKTVVRSFFLSMFLEFPQ